PPGNAALRRGPSLTSIPALVGRDAGHSGQGREHASAGATEIGWYPTYYAHLVPHPESSRGPCGRLRVCPPIDAAVLTWARHPAYRPRHHPRRTIGDGFGTDLPAAEKGTPLVAARGTSGDRQGASPEIVPLHQ